MGEMQYVLKKIAELPFNGALAFLLGERRTVCKIKNCDISNYLEMFVK
jgi:hypothetical protein